MFPETGWIHSRCLNFPPKLNEPDFAIARAWSPSDWRRKNERSFKATKACEREKKKQTEKLANEPFVYFLAFKKFIRKKSCEITSA